MTDTPGSRTDSDLGRILTAEVKMAVRRAMTDQAIKEVLRKEVADQVMSTVSADLEKQTRDRIAKEVAQIEVHVAEKVRKDLLESLTLATTVLKEGFEKARGTVPEIRGPVLAEAEPAMNDQKVRRPLASRMSAAGKVAAIVLALALLTIGYLIGWGVSSARQGPEWTATRTGTSQSSFVPTPTSAIPYELSVTAERTRDDWMKVVTDAEDQLPSGSPLRDIYRTHPLSDQFGCWFGGDAQRKLEKLAHGYSSSDIQPQLEDIFEPCFADKPRLRDPMLAIFSAQATVARTFSQYRNEWESWCAIADEASPPSSVADGFAGSATWEGMNLFLKCTGHSGELSIEPSSTAPQYLYVTYLALRELQRE